LKENGACRREYVRSILDAYRTTPGTTGHVRSEDRRLAVELYERKIPLAAVENALVLAAARRLLRPEGSPPLGLVRSLHYFRAVIDEVLNLKVSQDYFCYLRGKIEKSMNARGNL
jgi:hypothetical protein